MGLSFNIPVAMLCLSLLFGATGAKAETAQLERETRKSALEFEQLSFLYESKGVKFNATSEAYRIASAKRGAADAYVFVYTFKNDCEKKTRVLFQSQIILLSPLTQILQDFAVSLEPGETKTIVLIANARPETVLTQSVVAEHDGNEWRYFAGGSARLYVPLMRPETRFVASKDF